MNCQQALALLSAEIDHEIQSADQVRLREHLGQCETCRGLADALYSQDAELRRSFAPRRRAAAATAERVVARLAEVAPTGKEQRERRVPSVSRYFRWTLAAAVLLGIGFGLYRLAPRLGTVPNVPAGGEDLGSPIGELDYLTPRRLASGDLRPPLAVGEQRQTGANERQRVALPDGSVVYLNQNTRVRLDADRQLQVEAGEVFVEVAPAPGDSRPPLAGATFVVRTAQRQVTALGTKFAVKLEPAGTSVVVTQGKVAVSGVSGVLSAGQQLRADVDRIDPTPRASVILDWLREPIAAAESPLVPRSQYAGGSLIAVDPYGQEARLSLRNYRVDVHIEDGFARTTIDQTYFNHNGWRMEGTFYFPLPPDASLSRLAMYVADGKECNLMEGGMAERDYARNVFEQIVTRQKDPALLEWLDGSTFKMRVFPLEGRQEKRIILSYVQRLDSLYGRLGYRFPGGHNLPLVNKWSANIRVKKGADLAWSCAGYPLDKQTDGKDLVLSTSASDVKPDRDLALELVDAGRAEGREPPVGSLQPGAYAPRLASAVHEGARYLMVRYRPNLTSPRQIQRRDWVFLFESSGDRDPLLARAQIEIIRTLLNNAGHEDTFAIVQAGTRWRVLEAKQVTPANVKAGLEFLDKAHLIGALDLGTALREAVKLADGAPNPTIVHVGSGIAALGLRNENELSKRVPDHVPYVGVGVGKRWARNFMKATAERTGGAFTQINPDESIGWRSFELFSLLNTPRLMNVKVIDDMERVKFLTFNSMVAQGEEVCAIARIPRNVDQRAGDVSPPVPASVTIDGTFEGKPFRISLPVTDVKDKADYLPRAWAKLEIDRLVAEDKEQNKATIIDLSKKMYVMSPFTSLLVLENEQMYEQFKVDRGRKDHWALYPCPAKILTVYEPDPSQGIDVRNAPRGAEPTSQKPTIEQVLSSIVVRTRPGFDGPDWVAEARSEERRLRRIQAFGNLMDQGRYEEAYREAFTPTRPAMVATYDMTITATPISQRTYLPQLRTTIENREAEVKDLDERLKSLFPSGASTLSSRPYSMYVPTLRGPQGQPIMVNLDPERLRAYNLSPQDVARALDLGQMIAPSGNARIKDMMPIVSVNSIMIEKDVGGIPIRPETELYLRDVMSVSPPKTDEERQLLKKKIEFEIAFDTSKDRHSNLMAQYQQLLKQLEAYRADTGASMRAGLTRNPPDEDIAGRVKVVTDSLVTINLGSDSGLVRDHTLEVYRLKPRPTYLGVVRILDVRPNEAVGRLVQRRGAVRVGDEVATGIMASPHGKHVRLPNDNERMFVDLTAYAPGMNTSRADILATLDAEARPDPAMAPGTIDPGAARLISDARAAGWQSIRVPATARQPAFTVIFDGSGRFTYDRVTADGLRERGFCDGSTLWHLYPDLHIGARRAFSRHHAAELTALVPWALPTAIDLARGCNVSLRAPDTVRITPRSLDDKQPHAVLDMVFADGRLTERCVIEMPSGKVLARETYSAAGVVKLFDTNSKLVSETDLAIQPAENEPPLTPKTSSYAVALLPLRTADHADEKDDSSALPFEDAMLADAEKRIIAYSLTPFRFHKDQSAAGIDERKLGTAVLLIAAGSEIRGQMAVDLEGRSKEPLARYLRVVGDWRSQHPTAIGNLPGLADGFLQRLAAFRDLCVSWGDNESRREQTAIERQNTFDFIRADKASLPGWFLLSLVRQRAGDDAGVRRELLKLYPLFGEQPGIGYTARYEHAALLAEDGQTDKARAAYLDLYRKTLDAGLLPPIDGRFRETLQQGDANAWPELVRQSARSLIARNQRNALIALAGQCRLVDDARLADEVIGLALDGVPAAEKGPIALAAVAYHLENDQPAKAEPLVNDLLKDKRLAQDAGLWFLAAALAGREQSNQRSVFCLDRGLAIEFRHLPEVINVQLVRQQYGQLLAGYEKLISTRGIIDENPPRELIDRVVSAADRWRSLDTDPTAACQAAAQILKKLGATDLAWEYLTTPTALHPYDSQTLLQIARALAAERASELADRAFVAAFEAESTDPSILMERAAALRSAGKQSDARRIYRQIAHGSWQPRFEEVQQRARQYLGMR